MDLDVDIKNVEFLDYEKILQESREVAIEIATQEQAFSEEESLIVQNVVLDKSSNFFFLKDSIQKIKGFKENLILS
jgi:hypothetical protein